MTLFRQLYDPDSAALSYLVADPVTRAAAFIDPVPRQLATLGGLLAQLGLHLRYVLATHPPADAQATAPALRAATGARLAAHESSPMADCDQRLRDGDWINLGEEMLEVIHTPGVTPCSLTYRWGERLFTGDTLWIGCAGDLGGPFGDAAALYDSVHRRLFGLPDEYLVYPGHDRHGHRVSSIGQEKLTNADLRMARAAFLARARPAAEPAYL